MRLSKTDARIVAMAVALVAADWASKIWLTSQLALGDTRIVVDGWLYLLHRQNPGVAFSMFSGMSESLRVPVLGALGVLGIYLFTRIALTTEDRLSRIAAAAVVAGAIGNLGDRIVTGEVTDFILVPFFPFVWNIADAAITIGGVLLAVRMAIVPEPAPAPAGMDGGLDRAS